MFMLEKSWLEGGNGIGKQNVEGRMLLKFCDQKNLWQIHGFRRRKGR